MHHSQEKCSRSLFNLSLRWEENVMKLALFFLLFSAPTWARPVVLLGHFDAFGSASFNNSERVAKRLLSEVKNHPDFDLKLCALETVFDKSYFQLEDCMKDLTTPPKLILGLGEANCNFKIETMARNLDHTKGPDNEGNERKNSVIIPDGPREIGFLYALPQMYCSLTESERSQIQVSNNAGSFVCNNLAYQLAYRYPDTEFGFIHVPANYCKNLETKTKMSVNFLKSMIEASVKTMNVERLLTRKDDLQNIRREYRNDKCLSEFYKKTKGIDEKGFWTFLGTE